MTWHQPLCQACWDKERPHDRPFPLHREDRGLETCCMCGEQTMSGIYATYNPHAVPYPTDVGKPFAHCICGHLNMHHDIYSFDDPRPICCTEGCDCGSEWKQQPTPRAEA